VDEEQGRSGEAEHELRRLGGGHLEAAPSVQRSGSANLDMSISGMSA
jgi:hypothetical protein